MEGEEKKETKVENLTMPKFAKHKVDNCKQKFKSYFINNLQNIPQLKQSIVSLAINSNLQQELIRPTAWKIFLKTLTFHDNITLKHWLEETYDKRKQFKEKLNSLRDEIEKAKSVDSQKFSNFEEENSSIQHLIDKSDFELWCKEPEKYINEIYEYLHDEDEFQSDLYYIMFNVMNLGLNKFYDDSNDPESPKTEPKTYLQLRCDYILLKLKKHNPQLYNHFMDIQLSAEIILQRWLKCIFTREFTTEDCIYIWDNILANEFNISSKNLEYIDYFCVAMFDYISEDLLKHDQNECFLCLFKYPPFQTIDLLITRAESVKSNILRIDLQKETSFFTGFSSKMKGIKDKISNINMNDIKNIFKGKSDDEQKKEDILAELKKITDNKTRVKQLKDILSKYRNKFYADDRMKIDMLLNSLEKNV